MKTHGNIIRIILADDHEIFRDGFTVMLKKQEEIILVAEAKNGEQLITQVEKHNPDIVLTDIKMPGIDGVKATKLITEKFPHIGIIALSMFDDDNLIIDMLEAGAKGYLLKNAQKKEIIEAIKTVYQNKPYYCNNTTGKLAKMIAQSRYHPEKSAQLVSFTSREHEIIQLICREYSNKEISKQLHLSIRTIEGYRENILEKMNARNTAGIVVYAIRHNIYKP